MYSIISDRFQDHRNQHNYQQLCYFPLRYKRQTALFMFVLFMFLTFYFVFYGRTITSINEDENICQKLLEIVLNSNRTLCSDTAARRGDKQRIIALSMFGPKENSLFIDENFSPLIIPFLEEAHSLFPSWVIRLYSDEITIRRLNLYNLSMQSSNIDICNVNQIPLLGNVGKYLSGKLWRFLPTLDPTVDLLSSRDLDSPLTTREQTLIDKFLDSSYIFLSIRDHPLHGIPILGGLWTAALFRNRMSFLKLFNILLDKQRVQKYSLTGDQHLLTDIVWPKIKNQTLVFDSYTCQQFSNGHEYPFPTERPSRDCHVGCIRPCCKNSSRIIFNKPCPIKCRPNDHPEWIYC